MVEQLDGCAAFDERLLESAFAPSPDAELDSHLGSCARCRAARERYLATADAIAGALAHPLGELAPPRARPERARRRLAWLGVAMAAAALIALWLGLRPAALEITAFDGASLVTSRAGRVSLLDGSAHFELRRGALAIETPLGVVRCVDEADVTVSLARAEKGDSMNTKHKIAAVTLTVVAGIVWWVADGSEIAVPPGEVVIHAEKDEPTTSPAPALALVSDDRERAPIAEPGVAVVPSVEPATVEPSQPGSFEIFGRVIDAADGRPIEGAKVTLGARSSGVLAFGAQALTDALGKFRARSLPMAPSLVAGNIFPDPRDAIPSFLEVRAARYATFTELPWGGQFERRNPLERTGPIDLGDVRLARGATITGRVVRESDGTPVADAAILLAEDQGTGNFFLPCRATELARSRDDGTFELGERVAPPRGYVKHVLFAVSAEGLAWTPLDVIEGRERIDELRLVLASAARIEVDVRDPDGHPIEGASVTAEPHFEPLVLAWSDPSHGRLWLGEREDLLSLFSAITDVNGRAQLASLPSIERGAAYDVIASIAGRASAWQDGVIVAPGARSSIALVLERHVPRTIRGTVRDERGSPIEGASVGVGTSTGMLETSSDAKGVFAVEEPEPGDSLSLHVSAPGYVVFIRWMAAPRAQAVEGLEIVLARPLPIAGRIVDQLGHPVSGAQVRLNQGDQWRVLATPENATLDDGRFEFLDTFAGEWRMVIIGRQPESDWEHGIVERSVQGGDTRAEIVFERALDPGATVIAEIVDVASGAALEPRDAMLVQELEPGEERAPWVEVLRAVGSARGEHVRPGRWKLWVRADERAVGHVAFTVAPGEREVHLRLELGEPGTLAGRVLFDERIPFRPLKARAQLGEASSSVPTSEDWSGKTASASSSVVQAQPDGTFVVENATPGRWSIEIRDQGLIGSASVDVPRGGVGRAEIAPRLGSVLAFRASGVEPIDLIEVQIADGERKRWRSSGKIALGDADTFAREETVEPGRVRWRVAFKHGGVGPDLRDAAAPQAGELVLEPGSRVEIPVPVVPTPTERR